LQDQNRGEIKTERGLASKGKHPDCITQKPEGIYSRHPASIKKNVLLLLQKEALVSPHLQKENFTEQTKSEQGQVT